MPTLDTPRLIIRRFTMDDLPAVHRLLDVEVSWSDPAEGGATLEARKRWLEWTVLNYEQLAYLRQPPYGDRAIVLKETGQVIGVCGLVPCLDVYEQLPSLREEGHAPLQGAATAEVGLFYAMSPGVQRRGYATEAARAMVDYAFDHLRLRRIIATTTHDNIASIGVMRKLGMRIERNPYPEPPWLQVVGVLEGGQR